MLDLHVSQQAELQGVATLCAGKCILAWTVHRDPPTCPQCKAPFASLLTFRKLDGTMSDYAVEESVCLLKRAHWFEAYLKVLPLLQPLNYPASTFINLSL